MPEIVALLVAGIAVVVVVSCHSGGENLRKEFEKVFICEYITADRANKGTRDHIYEILLSLATKTRNKNICERICNEGEVKNMFAAESKAARTALDQAVYLANRAGYEKEAKRMWAELERINDRPN